jgi:hypothetical protein
MVNHETVQAFVVRHEKSFAKAKGVFGHRVHEFVFYVLACCESRYFIALVSGGVVAFVCVIAFAVWMNLDE